MTNLKKKKKKNSLLTAHGYLVVSSAFERKPKNPQKPLSKDVKEDWKRLQNTRSLKYALKLEGTPNQGFRITSVLV